MPVLASFPTVGGAESQVLQPEARGLYVMPCMGCGSRADTTDVSPETAEAVALRAAEYHATHCDAFIPGEADGFAGPFYGLLVSELSDGEEMIAFGPDLTVRRALAAFSAFTRQLDPTLHQPLRLDLGDVLGRRVHVEPTRFVRIDPHANAGCTWRAVRLENSLPAAWLI
ncbi:hypothetical protein ACIP25_11550 [Streptomyces massasporeus]|uniref:hypothetical protein n=1 Tax=Streptomyces massasporeus TaxID=67324 RepID=UPI0038234317